MINKIKAIILGHAIADAMGVPVEFKSRQELAADPVTYYRGYGTYAVPAGTWSDDTSMTLATLDSLAGGINYGDMMQKLCDWKQHAAYTATDEVFDMGITTSYALSAFLKGTPALECGLGDDYDNGNGSLMRILPAVLYCEYKMTNADIEEKIDFIHNVSALTHSHLRSKIGCGIYYFIIEECMNRASANAVRAGIAEARSFYNTEEYKAEFAHYHRLYDPDFKNLLESEIRSSGYVVDSLEAAVWCVLNTSSYEECILKAVNLGSDTDTVAAIAGGIAGAIYGMEGIPQKWIVGLIRGEMVEELYEKFIVL